MNNTLIINDGNYEVSKKAGDILALILKCSKNIDINYAPMDISNYNNIVLVLSTYQSNTKENEKEYLMHIKYMLTDVKLIIVCINAKDDESRYLEEIYKSMGRQADCVEYINDTNFLNEIDSKTLKKTFKYKGVNDIIRTSDIKGSDVISVYNKIYQFINNSKKKMPEQRLKEEIKHLIKGHKTCAFATGYKNFIRNSPMKYIYYKNNFYFITEGGINFKGVLQNENVSIAIFNNYDCEKDADGLQVLGKSSVVLPQSREYEEVIEQTNMEIEVTENMPININMIKVEPEEIELVNSNFQNEGFDARQICSLEKKF